jgi:hypothetical protein
MAFNDITQHVELPSNGGAPSHARSTFRGRLNFTV